MSATRPDTPPDFEAEVEFLPSERSAFVSDTVNSGIRVPLNLRHPLGEFNDAMHLFVGRDSLPLGERAKSEVWLLVPERQLGRLHPGFEYTIQLGNRVIGKGYISKIINQGLLQCT